MAELRIKKLPSKGKQANRRYKLHHNLRKKGLLVIVPQRTIMNKEVPTGRLKEWCDELKAHNYSIQLTL